MSRTPRRRVFPQESICSIRDNGPLPLITARRSRLEQCDSLIPGQGSPRPSKRNSVVYPAEGPPPAPSCYAVSIRRINDTGGASGSPRDALAPPSRSSPTPRPRAADRPLPDWPSHPTGAEPQARRHRLGPRYHPRPARQGRPRRHRGPDHGAIARSAALARRAPQARRQRPPTAVLHPAGRRSVGQPCAPDGQAPRRPAAIPG
jgi:hypothetical protein